MIDLSKQPARIPAGRLTLRHLCAADGEALSAILRSEAVAKTYMLPVFSAPEEALALARRLCDLSAGGGHFVYGAFLGDRLVGFLNDVEIGPETIEVGYVVAPACWSRGYATEMLTAAIAALFVLGFSAVRAGYFEENGSSRRVMEKSGMAPLDKTEEIAYRGRTHRCRYCERKNLKNVGLSNRLDREV